MQDGGHKEIELRIGAIGGANRAAGYFSPSLKVCWSWPKNDCSSMRAFGSNSDR